MACHPPRHWTLLPVGLIAANLLLGTALDAAGTEDPTSIAFVSDTPLAAQGPAGGSNRLRYADTPTARRNPADGNSRLVVVDNATQTAQSRFGMPLESIGFGTDRPAQTVRKPEPEKKGILQPVLRFLGRSDDDDESAVQNGASSIAVVDPNANAGGQLAQNQNSPIFDPNVTPTAMYRETSRSGQVQLRQQTGNRGSFMDRFQGGSNQATYRQPQQSSGGRQRVPNSPIQQPLSQQQTTGAYRQNVETAPTPSSRQQLAEMTRRASAGAANSNMNRAGNAKPMVPPHRVAGNTPVPIGGSRMVTGTPRPSPQSGRRIGPAQLSASSHPSTGQRQLSQRQPQSSARSQQPAAQARPLTPADKHVQQLIVTVHQQSQTAETEDDFTLVAESCRRALAVQPKGPLADYSKMLCAWALNRRGQLRADAGDDRRAMIDFEDAIHLDSGQWRAVHNRGVLFAQAGKFEKAFDDFNLCTELNPQFAKAYSNRAALFVQAGDLLSALQDYRRAITLDPALAVAHKGRGRVCHMLGSTEEALQHFDAAAQLAPEDAHVIASRADLLADMGRYAQAAMEYHRAIMLDSQLAHAYRSSAWLMATCPDDSVRDTEQALAHAEKAVELDDRENPVSLDTLAAALANAGDYDAAVQTIGRAIEIAPEEEQAVYRSRLKLYQRSQPFRVAPVTGVATVSYDE